MTTVDNCPALMDQQRPPEVSTFSCNQEQNAFPDDNFLTGILSNIGPEQMENPDLENQPQESLSHSISLHNVFLDENIPTDILPNIGTEQMETPILENQTQESLSNSISLHSAAIMSNLEPRTDNTELNDDDPWPDIYHYRSAQTQADDDDDQQLLQDTIRIAPLKKYILLGGMSFALFLLIIIVVVMAVIYTKPVASQNRIQTFVATSEALQSELNARSFLYNPRVFAAIPTGGNITGLTVMDSQLFVVRGNVAQVSVFDTNNFTLTRNITITGSTRLRAIVASPRNNCLYMCDDSLKVVHRYNLTGNVFSNWSVGGGCEGLSLTSTHNVLSTLYDTKQIKEYTPNRDLVREISLDSSITFPWHSVQLSSGQFVVSHGILDSLSRVCMVDTSGRIIQCFGKSKGSDFGPRYLRVDEHDNVLVTDYFNNRVVLLSPSLTHLDNIVIPGQTLNGPWNLHLDLLTNRLYIGEYRTGRVIVISE